jgi:glycosyltransferase involved in cell wall biosynthesis
VKITIDATGLGGVKTGTAVYLTEILKAWNADPTVAHEFVIFASPKTAGYLRSPSLDGRFSFVDSPNARAWRIVWQQLVMPWHLLRLAPDVHWGCGFVLPLLWRGATVVTIYDLTFQLFPAVHEPVKRFYFPAMIAAAVRQARRVIAISAATEADLHHLLPASRGKTAVTLLAPRSLPQAAHATEVDSAEPYLVCLGTLEPRKNLERLLAAWLGIAEDERRGVRLMVVGVRGWLMDELLAHHQGAQDSVAFTGYLDDAALKRLLEGALALAYPSLYEGFGLPVLEAMAVGVPVLTSDVGATKEISGDAALLVDPTDVGAIRKGLRRLLGDADLRARLATLGRARAAQFSWVRTARQTLAVLGEAARG